MMDADEPIEIYTVNNPVIAELIRNALRDEGIACELSGESQGGFAGVLEEIQVLTKAADAERALAIIHAIEKEQRESTESDESDEGEVEGTPE
jgi:hypothetical protein